MDFDGLVLGPLINVFGEPVVVRPKASQPLLAEYVANGIFSQRAVEVELQGGAVHSTVVTTLGIRLSTFSVPVAQDDFVQVRGVWYVVFDSNPDGQGGATLELREALPS